MIVKNNKILFLEARNEEIHKNQRFGDLSQDFKSDTIQNNIFSISKDKMANSNLVNFDINQNETNKSLTIGANSFNHSSSEAGSDDDVLHVVTNVYTIPILKSKISENKPLSQRPINCVSEVKEIAENFTLISEKTEAPYDLNNENETYFSAKKLKIQKKFQNNLLKMIS